MSSKPTSKRSRGEYIETDTGNKISRHASITGTSHIILAGRVVVSPRATLRGDLVKLSEASTGTAPAPAASRTAISVSRYTFIAPYATLHPPYRIQRDGTIVYYTQKIDSNVYIAAHAFIQAANIGANSYIGENVVIGNGCVLKESCKVIDGAVLPDGMVVPSNTVVAGRPARIVGEVGAGWGISNNNDLWVEGGELRELIRSVK